MRKEKEKIDMLVFKEDKYKFQDLSRYINKKNKKITQAVLFREMVNWLEKNIDIIAKKYSSVYV